MQPPVESEDRTALQADLSRAIHCNWHLTFEIVVPVESSIRSGVLANIYRTRKSYGIGIIQRLMIIGCMQNQVDEIQQTFLRKHTLILEELPRSL
jgi:hypothetical protein